MEDFFNNTVDAGVPRAVLFPAGYKVCTVNKTINPTIRDQTSYPLQNMQKGNASFTMMAGVFQKDLNGCVILVEVGQAKAGCRPKQSLKHQRKRLTGNVSHLFMVKTRTTSQGSASARTPPLSRGKRE